MPFELTTMNDGTNLTLAGCLGIQDAGQLWEALRAADEAKPIRLSAPEVEGIDTSIVQILCRVGKHLEIGEISDGFMLSLRQRGLEHFFSQARREVAPSLPVPEPVQTVVPKQVKRKRAIASQSPKQKAA